MSARGETVHPRHGSLRRTGAVLAILGIVLILLSMFVSPATARAEYEFQGNCVGGATAGTCVLDEPEGKNPAVHGTVTYALVGALISFTISTPAPIDEVQICMQTSGPFPQGANVCAGSHGHHVPFVQAGSVYSVDLDGVGFGAAALVYWTLHVVSGGRTLQVSGGSQSPPPTTSTTPTTSPPSSTSTTAPGSSTTTTTDPGATTTTEPTPTTAAASTTSLAVGAVTSTTQPLEVAGRTFARTGEAQWWFLISGSVLMIIGVTLLVSTRVLGPF